MRRGGAEQGDGGRPRVRLSPQHVAWWTEGLFSFIGLMELVEALPD